MRTLPHTGFVRTGFALALAGAAVAATPAWGQERTLVLSAFGVSQDLLRKNLYAPFEAKCKCKIVVEVGNSADRLAKMEARKANPEVDIAVLADFNALEAQQKDLLDPIDYAKIPNVNNIYDFAKDPLGNKLAVGYSYYATSVIYRNDKVKIESWGDLLKPELKNRLALPNITTTQGPLLLYMMDKALGGTTPDFATAIGKIGEIKGNVVTFYERSAQLAQLFQQDEIWATVTGRFNWPLLKKLNMPTITWATPKEGITGGLNVLVLTKNGKNRELAHEFINEWLSAEAQTRIAMDLVDSPINKDVKLPPDIADLLSYGEQTAKAINVIPPAQVLANRNAWVAGWNAKIAR